MARFPTLLFTVAVIAAAPRLEAAPPVRAPVVVTLVIDQLAAWIAEERFASLPPEGGFARLRKEGTSATLVYRHAVTDTAPGHATLYTGADPRDHGIFANEVIDRADGKKLSILRDAGTKVITADGPREAASSSLAPLLLPTLADALRAANPRATIVSLAIKERAALPGGGRAPTATLWFDVGLGRFITSSAVSTAFPTWAAPLSGADMMVAEKSRVWTPLDAAFVAAHAATPDAQPGEGDLDGIGTSFPHAMAAATNLPHAWRATPFADEKLIQLAIAAVEARDVAQPMLLAISLSANDYISHVFGPDSWEAWDELRRLDVALATFFAALDARLGAAGWSLLLSGDHGAAMLPEAASLARPWCKRATADRWQRPCGDAGRIIPNELAARLRKHSDLVAGVADPYIYLVPATAANAERRRAAIESLRAELLRQPGIATVVATRPAAARCPTGDSVEALVCRSIPAGGLGARSAAGELYVALRPGWFFDPEYVVGKGMSHGSPYLYDRAVPLVVRAPGRASAGRVVAAPQGPATFAVTAARLLGIEPPKGATGAASLAR